MISPLIDPAGNRNVIKIFLHFFLYILTAVRTSNGLIPKWNPKENCIYIHIYTVCETSSSSSNAIKWRGNWQPTPVLPGKSHGQRSLEATVPWGRRVGHD